MLASREWKTAALSLGLLWLSVTSTAGFSSLPNVAPLENRRNNRSSFDVTKRLQQASITYKQQLSPKKTRAAQQQPLLIRRHEREWDGDDLRWTQKIRRRLIRGQTMDGIGLSTPAISSLILINFLMFFYQTIDTINLIRIRNPSFWPGDAIPIITDTLLGTTNIQGGLTMNFIFSGFIAKRQPHRYLTAGFLHGSIIHLFLNLSAMRSLPAWLESGLGTPLFLTTYLVSIVTGNINHYISNADGIISRSFCLGASGGICGIYGLMFVALSKMGNKQSAMRVTRGIFLLLISGLFIDNVSNAGHFGGFIGGVVMGILFAPNYKKSYSMRKKFSLEADPWSKGYRQVMGFGISPSGRGLFPLSVFWVLGALTMVTDPIFRSIPTSIVRGLLKPGSLFSYY